METERLQILISSVNKDAKELVKRMKAESGGVVINERIGAAPFPIDAEASWEFREGGHLYKVKNIDVKGVGVSRNAALLEAESELIQFADDDIVYDEGYAGRIVQEFDAHPEADILLFNVKQQKGRETYHNTDYARVSWYNYGRYPAYAICARREKLINSGVRYSLLFGGGAPHMNGEDSLFLHDCLKAGLRIYRTDVLIGEELSGESTWFKGYTDKFFFDRGVLYHFLYGRAAFLWGFRFLFKNRNEMCREMGLLKCYRLLLDGVKYGRDNYDE